LRGDVVEVGFGTGLNVPYYPPEVARIFAVEPSTLCMHLAEPRIAEQSVPVEQAGLTGERLELPSGEFDAVLSTWTMCTIPDLDSALQEIRRALRPGGALHFVEHGHAPDPNVARWQRRIEPMQKRLAGGCHLTRRKSESIEQAGFESSCSNPTISKGNHGLSVLRSKDAPSSTDLELRRRWGRARSSWQRGRQRGASDRVV
jgi:SAM-dependent methyltransferase